MATRAWVPTDAVGVKVYEFDPSIAANIDVSGGLVTALRSSDGSLSAKPTTDAERPVYNATGINGGPSIKFYNNGVANRLKTQAFTQGPNWAVFAVIKQSENTGTQSIIDADNYNTGTGSRVAQCLRFDGTNIQSIAFTPAVSTASASVGQGTNLALKILGASLPSRTVQVSVDGGTLATATLNADPIGASAVLTLGSWTANNQNFRGDLAIAYDVQGSLSQDDYDRFVGYLAARFNKQGDLPANHPYKTAAPTIDDGTGSGSTTASLVATEAGDAASGSAASATTAGLGATESQDAAAGSAASGTTGALGATEGQDAASAVASATTAGTLVASEGQDTAAGAGGTQITGTLSASEARDTAAFGSQGGAATLAAAEQADVASIAGGEQTRGDLIALEAADTAAAAASTGGAAAVAGTEPADAAAIDADSRTAANLADSERADSAALVGTTGGQVNADLAASEGRDTAAIRGEMFTRPNVILVAQRGDRIVLQARRNAPFIIKARRAAS